MQFKLETPEHQRTAIRSVVEMFHGMERNTYDNSTDEDIRANYCSLPLDALMANIRWIAADNGIEPSRAFLQESRDVCIEMETGTGKTLTYLQSAYELHKEYGLTKFICIERALDTTKKFNLKNKMQDKFFAF
jgi:type III restriction enzyme